jgi:hypothetical protein
MRCSRRFAERFIAGALALLLDGCTLLAEQTPGALGVRSARLGMNAATLDLALDCKLSGPMQDALDHGIPITLRVDVHAGTWPHVQSAAPRIELRYFPLSRRYQLRQWGSEDVRSYATRGYLVDALGSLHVALPSEFAQLPAQTALRVSARIDPGALPGALRLPALFEPAWRLASAEFAWTRAAP